MRSCSSDASVAEPCCDWERVGESVDDQVDEAPSQANRRRGLVE